MQLTTLGFLFLLSYLFLYVCSESNNHKKLFKSVFDQTFEHFGLLSFEGKVLAINNTSCQAVRNGEKSFIGLDFWDTPWGGDEPEEK